MDIEAEVEAARCPALPAHAGQETLPACGSRHSIHWRLLTNRILPGHGHTSGARLSIWRQNVSEEARGLT